MLKVNVASSDAALFSVDKDHFDIAAGDSAVKNLLPH